MKALCSLQTLVLEGLRDCKDLHCLPVLPGLKTLVIREGSLGGIERQQPIENVELFICYEVDLHPVAALSQLTSLKFVDVEEEQDLAPLAHHPVLREVLINMTWVLTLNPL